MITATRTAPRTEHLCDRCGINLGPARPTTRNCASCRDVTRAGTSPSSTKRARQIAKTEGWDYEHPHLGPWGTNG